MRDVGQHSPSGLRRLQAVVRHAEPPALQTQKHVPAPHHAAPHSPEDSPTATLHMHGEGRTKWALPASASCRTWREHDHGPQAYAQRAGLDLPKAHP